MRTKRKMCFTLDVEVTYELRGHGNRSQLVNMALRDYFSTLDSNRKMLNRVREKHFGNIKLSPKEEDRERLRKEEQEKKLSEIQRKRQEEEAKRIKQKEEEKLYLLKSDPIEQLKMKHWRENRTNPDHDPYECWWCKNYSDIGNYWKDR